MAIQVTLDPSKKKQKSITKYLKLLQTAGTAQNVAAVNRLLARYNRLQRTIAKGYLTVTGN